MYTCMARSVIYDYYTLRETKSSSGTGQAGFLIHTRWTVSWFSSLKETPSLWLWFHISRIKVNNGDLNHSKSNYSQICQPIATTLMVVFVGAQCCFFFNGIVKYRLRLQYFVGLSSIKDRQTDRQRALRQTEMGLIAKSFWTKESVQGWLHQRKGRHQI